MKKGLLFPLCILLLVFACQTVPITGRQQLQLLPADTVFSLSLDAYKEFLSEHRVVANTKEAEMVKNVGQRIQRSVEQFFASRNMSDQLRGYRWEFNLVDDKEVNAWCMPGGKVVVYNGILPVAQNETGLAVVMGHEIAHAVANHGNERMSQAMLVEMGGVGLSAALSQYRESSVGLVMAVYGIGTGVGVLLPYSRLQESESDRLGLIFMAMAGYDPHAAVDFWKRMAASKQGASPPEFLSTHPADATRIRNIEGLIPEAMGYYRKW